jgi:hypothetical protein
VDPLPRELFEPFSKPGVPAAREALDVIWPTFAEEATRLFLEGHRKRFDEAAPSLAEWLRSRIGDLSLDDSWHPITGLLARPPELTKRPVALATTLALHLVSRTADGEWTAEIEPDAPLRLHNLIARPERVAVRGGDGAAEVTVSDGNGGASLRLADDPWAPLDATGALRSAGLYLSRPIRLLVTSGAVPGDSFFVEEADPFDVGALASFAGDVRAGLDFVAELGPEWLDWIETAVTVVVPCHAPADMLRSGSSNTQPGLVRLTAGRPPSTTAEMLVHEASHQYLHAALRVAPVDDGSDPNLYFSPVKQQPRPIDKILTAYHAFANVELFYAKALENGWQPDDREADAVARVTEELDVLEAPLRETGALTTAGRGLVEPLVAARGR